MSLEFDPAAHRYKLDGTPVPSVTQVLDPLLELWRIPAAVLKAAGDFGAHVHLACHLWNLGQLDEAALDPHLQPYLLGWKNFLSATGCELVNSEQQVFHPKYRYAGTLDAQGLMPRPRSRDPVHTLIDIKSGLVPPTVGPQTAAYAECLRAMPEPRVIKRRLCVQLHDGGPPFFKVFDLTEVGDFSMFLSALNIFRFKERHA